MIRKLMAIIMFGMVLLYVLREYFLIVIGVFIMLVLIRFAADIYWWGKDKDKW